MTISSKQVAKIAQLSRLNSNPDEAFITKYAKEIDDILVHVDQLNLAPQTHSLVGERTVSVSMLREDVVSSDIATKKMTRDAIVAQFPISQGDLLILPGIFHDN